MQAVTLNRNLYIGGSDIPIILGISSFKSRFDLLLEKAGLKDNDFSGNEYTEYGNELEPQIRDYINEFYGKNFKEGCHIDGDIRCHTDGEDATTILEIKTTSRIYKNIDDYKVYLVQLLFYMQQTNRNSGMLAVYERPSDFNKTFDAKRLHTYMINIDNYKTLLEQINQAVEQFRFDLVKVKANPFVTEEELLPVNITELSNKLLVIEQQLLMYNELAKQEKELKAMLKKAMEDNNVKKWTTNNGVQITLVSDGEDKVIKKFNEDKFKNDDPELYKKYLEEKLMKGRAGYVKVTAPKKGE